MILLLQDDAKDEQPYEDGTVFEVTNVRIYGRVIIILE